MFCCAMKKNFYKLIFLPPLRRGFSYIMKDKIPHFEEYQKEKKIEYLLKSFTPEEHIRMLFIPLILAKATFRYLETTLSYCTEHKLPYKKEIRKIREIRQEFEREHCINYTFEDRKVLDAQVDTFFSETNLDIQIVWFTVNREFLKRYPNLNDEYTFLSNIYTTITFIEYIHDYELKSNARINKCLATSTSLGMLNSPISCENKYLTEIGKILHSMIAKYRIDKTYMIDLAMRIISRKINESIITYENEVQR